MQDIPNNKKYPYIISQIFVFFLMVFVFLAFVWAKSAQILTPILYKQKSIFEFTVLIPLSQFAMEEKS